MFESLDILIIGVGSMGKRRIRNLKSLGITNLFGVDSRNDRCDEAKKVYGIQCFTAIEAAFQFKKYDAWIISVPPDKHHIYMSLAVSSKVPVFVEASVVEENIAEIIAQATRENVFIAPSCTFFFHPAIQKINALLKSGELGKVSSIIYHSGQYLPDWHKYEKVSEYYVSKKETGGAREIVPFELTWITMLFGFPFRVTGFNKKTIDIEGAESIDDTYSLILDYTNFVISLNVDVVSRHATRNLVINGEKKQLVWNWDRNKIEIFDPILDDWTEYSYETISAEQGYNKNITEQMYIDEMAAFLKAIYHHQLFPNSLERDHKVLQILYKAEESSNSNKIQYFE